MLSHPIAPLNSITRLPAQANHIPMMIIIQASTTNSKIQKMKRKKQREHRTSRLKRQTKHRTETHTISQLRWCDLQTLRIQIKLQEK